MLSIIFLSGYFQFQSLRYSFGESVPNQIELIYLSENDEMQIEILSDRRTLVLFWADYCITCKADLKELNLRVKEFEKKYDILALAHSKVDSTVEFASENAIDRLKLGFSTQEIREKYGIIGQPVTIIIDTDGGVIYKHFGPLLFDEILNF